MDGEKEENGDNNTEPIYVCTNRNEFREGIHCNFKTQNIFLKMKHEAWYCELSKCRLICNYCKNLKRQEGKNKLEKYPECKNNCYECSTNMDNDNYFDHLIKIHCTKLNTQIIGGVATKSFLNINDFRFNELRHFWFEINQNKFYLECNLTPDYLTVNLLSNIQEDYGSNYYDCSISAKWLNNNINIFLNPLQTNMDWGLLKHKVNKPEFKVTEPFDFFIEVYMYKKKITKTIEKIDKKYQSYYCDVCINYRLQLTPDFIFNKHREWFCTVKKRKCPLKCISCKELQEKCISLANCAVVQESSSNSEGDIFKEPPIIERECEMVKINDQIIERTNILKKQGSTKKKVLHYYNLPKDTKKEDNEASIIPEKIKNLHEIKETKLIGAEMHLNIQTVINNASIYEDKEKSERKSTKNSNFLEKIKRKGKEARIDNEFQYLKEQIKRGENEDRKIEVEQPIEYIDEHTRKRSSSLGEQRSTSNKECLKNKMTEENSKKENEVNKFKRWSLKRQKAVADSLRSLFKYFNIVNTELNYLQIDHITDKEIKAILGISDEAIKTKAISKQPMSKHLYKPLPTTSKNKFENCPICYEKYRNCPNKCFDCSEVLKEKWFTHYVSKHSIKMKTIHNGISIKASSDNLAFNNWHRFSIEAFNQIFFIECEFHLAPDLFMLNMVVDMEKFGHEYFNCSYELTGDDFKKSGLLQYPNWDSWDWNAHVMFDDKYKIKGPKKFNLTIIIEKLFMEKIIIRELL